MLRVGSVDREEEVSDPAIPSVAHKLFATSATGLINPYGYVNCLT